MQVIKKVLQKIFKTSLVLLGVLWLIAYLQSHLFFDYHYNIIFGDDGLIYGDVGGEFLLNLFARLPFWTATLVLLGIFIDKRSYKSLVIPATALSFLIMIATSIFLGRGCFEGGVSIFMGPMADVVRSCGYGFQKLIVDIVSVIILSTLSSFLVYRASIMWSMFARFRKVQQVIKRQPWLKKFFFIVLICLLPLIFTGIFYKYFTYHYLPFSAVCVSGNLIYSIVPSFYVPVLLLMLVTTVLVLGRSWYHGAAKFCGQISDKSKLAKHKNIFFQIFLVIVFIDIFRIFHYSFINWNYILEPIESLIRFLVLLSI